MNKKVNNYRSKRKWIPADIEIKDWGSIKEYFERLLNFKINSVQDLKIWLKDWSELESALQEELAWRYIKMNCDTRNKKLTEYFEQYVSEIEPRITEFNFRLNQKFYKNPFLNELDGEAYAILIKQIQNQIELFRNENIPLEAEMQKKEQNYGKISSEMSIKYLGNEITLQMAANYLKDTNRNTREDIYRLIWNRRLSSSKELDELLSELINIRQKLASNAGFENFRDYMFRKLERFDYQVEDCYRFHEAVKSEVIPLIESIQLNRKQKLGLEKLKPWDLDVDENMKQPLKPFVDAHELIQKTKACFSKVDPEFAQFIEIMETGKFLDLDSRMGKAPGGFNYPLHESNIPFIFMNATGNLRDVETMVHEGGHAVHAFLCRDLELSSFKETPSEVAELASMSMELISMEHWEAFFSDPDDLKRAKLSTLKGTIEMLPWVAQVDKFQHEIYLEKNISAQKCKNIWNRISLDYSGNVVDWEGLEEIRFNLWQKQLHIFEVPFYYIEYGFAQLGAIAVWRNYKMDPQKALLDFKNALKLGYTKSIPEIYKTAGIEFNFSKDYIRELMIFVREEIKKLNDG